MGWHIGRKKSSFLKFLLCAFFAFLARNEAVVFFSSGDPEFNTAPPTGSLTDCGWQWQGRWELFLGTPISSNYFLTAKHVGGAINSNFVFQGTSHFTTARFDHPRADLTLWRVSGVFTNFAPIYTGSDEVGHSLVVFGRGLQRGPEIRLTNELKGWLWGNTDFRLRWGENLVTAITDRKGDPITSTNRAQYLRATFDANAGPNEAHLSNGDSGGGVFIQEEGVWKLAGINSAADGEYNTNSVGKGFEATLFDERGFYRGGENEWELQSGDSVQPGAFYATRVSAYATWIRNVVAYGNPKGEMSVEEAASPGGPFATAVAAEINGESQTIRLSKPLASRFYRLRAMEQARIATITNSSDGLVITFE